MGLSPSRRHDAAEKIMNAPFNPMRLPEAGPISPPEWEWPEPPEIVVSDAQIVQRVMGCLAGQSDTAFGQDKRYWSSELRGRWDVEWVEQASDMDLMNIDQAPDRIAYIQKMMCIHARELLRDDRVPIELMIEEGLI